MAKKQRVDKVLSNLGYGSRAELKKLCKQGLVFVNGNVVSIPALQVDTDIDEIVFNGEKINYREFIYLMMNKPDGYISATFDKHDPIVLDLIYDEYLVFEPFPVGRLDKDTEGLLVLTNDGQLAHRVLSPKNPGLQVDTDIDEIVFNGEKINYREFIYLMMNKPDGYISATFDKHDPIVLDLIDDE